MIQHLKNIPCNSGLPLVIGVTGHRDLIAEDIPALKNRLIAIIENLKEQYPSTPLMLMSALAEGADRLVAEVALNADIGLIVPLPMSQELYEKDFADTSVKQFRGLLDRADISYTLPIAPGSTVDAVRAGGAARDHQYYTAARFIVEHSQLLIAMWDGVTGGPMGGTSQVVRMQLEGIDELSNIGDYDLFAPLQTGPVIHLLTRREDSSPPPDEVYLSHHRSIRKILEGVSFLYPRNDDDTASREDEENRTLACIERFNRDSIDIFRLAPDFDAKRQHSAEYVFPESSDETGDTCSQDELSPSAAQLLAHFAHTDALAQQFQQYTHETLYILPCLIPFIVFFLGVYSNITTAMFAITGYLVAISLAYGIYIATKRQGVHEKFLDYRALAEGMRITLFWRLAGIREAPASFYLSKQQSELDWIRYAMRIWGLLALKGCEEKVTSRSLMAVKTYWLTDQMNYFGRKARDHNQTANQLDTIAKGFFWLGLFVMTPAMLLIHGLKVGGEALDPWMMVATPLFFVIAGSINFYSYRMLFSEHAKQYARMYGIFKKSLHLLDGAADDETRQQFIILAVGKEALAENGDWVLIHRERPIEVPG